MPTKHNTGSQSRSGTVGDTAASTAAGLDSHADLGHQSCSNTVPVDNPIAGGTDNSAVASPDAHHHSNTVSDSTDNSLAGADSGSQICAIVGRKEPTATAVGDKEPVNDNGNTCPS